MPMDGIVDFVQGIIACILRAAAGFPCLIVIRGVFDVRGRSSYVMFDSPLGVVSVFVDFVRDTLIGANGTGQTA